MSPIFLFLCVAVGVGARVHRDLSPRFRGYLLASALDQWPSVLVLVLSKWVAVTLTSEGLTPVAGAGLPVTPLALAALGLSIGFGFPGPPVGYSPAPAGGLVGAWSAIGLAAERFSIAKLLERTCHRRRDQDASDFLIGVRIWVGLSLDEYHRRIRLLYTANVGLLRGRFGEIAVGLHGVRDLHRIFLFLVEFSGREGLRRQLESPVQSPLPDRTWNGDERRAIPQTTRRGPGSPQRRRLSDRASTRGQGSPPRVPPPRRPNGK